MQRTPLINPTIICRHIDGEAVLLDPATGKYFGLNPVGYNVWQKIDGNISLQQIVDLMLTEYNVEREILTADVLELIAALEKNSLVSWK